MKGGAEELKRRELEQWIVDVLGTLEKARRV